MNLDKCQSINEAKFLQERMESEKYEFQAAVATQIQLWNLPIMSKFRRTAITSPNKIYRSTVNEFKISFLMHLNDVKKRANCGYDRKAHLIPNPGTNGVRKIRTSNSSGLDPTLQSSSNENRLTNGFYGTFSHQSSRLVYPCIPTEHNSAEKFEAVVWELPQPAW